MHQSLDYFMPGYHYELVHVLDSTKACLAARSKPKYSKQNEFFLSHPYNCQWYIWCYDGGLRGVEMECAPPARFNSNYTSRKDYCLDPKWLTHCTETTYTTSTTTTTTTAATTTTTVASSKYHVPNLPIHHITCSLVHQVTQLN